MKKKILTTCIALLTVFICVFFAACGGAESFEVKSVALKNSVNAAQLTKEICEQYPERTMGTGDDYKFLGYLAEKMTSYGYPAAELENAGGSDDAGEGGELLADAASDGASVTVEKFTFDNIYTGATETGYNLVYYVPAAESTDRTVLLLAAYDNIAGLEISSQDLMTGQITTSKTGGEGAYSNATGVAVLLKIASELAGEELPYNLEIAFVDCSENEWDGARQRAAYYAEKNCPFICLNFNRLGAGDYTYIYSDETDQAYNDYFYSVVDKTDDGGVFAEIPFNKQTADIRYTDAQKTEYSHYAMYGDNLMFNVFGLAVASYVSFNWSSFENPFYTETEGYANILGTSADTYATVIERLGGGEKGEQELARRLDAVALNAVTAVSAQNADTLFGAVAASNPAKSGDYAENAETASMIVKIVLVAAAICFALWLTVRSRSVLVQKQKEKIEKLRREATGATPPADDVFDIGGDKDRDGNDKKDDGSGGGSDGDVFEGF